MMEQATGLEASSLLPPLACTKRLSLDKLSREYRVHRKARRLERSCLDGDVESIEPWDFILRPQNKFIFGSASFETNAQDTVTSPPSTQWYGYRSMLGGSLVNTAWRVLRWVPCHHGMARPQVGPLSPLHGALSGGSLVTTAWRVLRWVPCHHCMARSQVADVEGG
jgi:hypothetical protein